MHRCLQIEEILRNVLECHADAPESLVNMALTCRAFYEPAMYIRWRTLRSLEPLMRLLPRHKWDWCEPCPEIVLLTITAENGIKPREWKRFQHHAKRVQELFITLDRTKSGKALFVNYDCYDTLLEDYPGDRALPNLRKVTCEVGRVEYFLPSVLHPSFCSLAWKFEDEEDALDLLDEIRTTCPSLQDLKMIEEEFLIASEGVPPAVYDSLWETICSLNHLRSLDVRSLSPSALQHVSMLPTFRKLSFHMANYDYRQALSESHTARFLHLEELDVTTSGEDIAPLLGFLAMLPASGLVKLRLVLDRFHENPREDWNEPDPQPTAQRLHEIFTSLARVSTIQSITVELGARPYFMIFDDEYFVDDITLAPLFALKGLLHLKLPNVPMSIDRDGLCAVARALPSIRTLDLGHDCFTSEVRNYTIFDLVPFAEYCPDLEELSVLAKPAEGTVDFDQWPVANRRDSKVRDIEMGGGASIEEDSPEFRDAKGFSEHVFPRALVLWSFCSICPVIGEKRERSWD